MGETDKVVFQSDTVGKLGLDSHVQMWKEDKISADQVGLKWAALQGKYYGGGRSVKYVTRGSIITCNRGNLYSRIDLPIDHGVETKSTRLPILTVQDFGSQNISSFGECSLKSGMSSTKCITQITSQWTQNAITTYTANAALLQADAFAVCNMGGLVFVKEVNKTPQESLMAILEEQYGFDERTIKIILNLYQAIQKKYSGETQIKRDWRFARLLGGLKYGLKEKEGKGEEFKWNKTAGDATLELYEIEDGYGQTFETNIDLPVKSYMTSELGLNDDDYEYLQYKVRVQHFLVDKEASDMKYNKEGKNKKKKTYPEDYYTNMKIGLGGSLDESEFIDIWSQQCDDMCGMTDFAHQQITTATILATTVNEDSWMANVYVGGVRKREKMAGWLGDATIYGKNGEPPSFKNDDYMADLDAENIGYMVREEGYSYIVAIENYYEKRLLEKNRAELFLEKNNIESVKEQIYNELFLAEYVDKLSSTNDFETRRKIDELYKNDDNWLKMLKERVPDAYNFYRSLKDGVPEMGNY